MQFIVMTSEEAANIQSLTSNNTSRLAPRLIEAGNYAGQYATPSRALSDPDLQYVHGFLTQYPIVDIDPLEAWPPQE